MLLVSFQKCILPSHRSLVLTLLPACCTPTAPQCVVLGHLYFPKIEFPLNSSFPGEGRCLQSPFEDILKEMVEAIYPWISQMWPKREWKLWSKSLGSASYRRVLLSEADARYDKILWEKKYKGAHCMNTECQNNRLQPGTQCTIRYCTKYKHCRNANRLKLPKKPTVLTIAGHHMWIYCRWRAEGESEEEMVSWEFNDSPKHTSNPPLHTRLKSHSEMDATINEFILNTWLLADVLSSLAH